MPSRNMEGAPAQEHAYGFPGTDTGTWSFIPRTGSGVFGDVCAGWGSLDLYFGGAAGDPVYDGQLTLC